MWKKCISEKDFILSNCCQKFDNLLKSLSLDYSIPDCQLQNYKGIN